MKQNFTNFVTEIVQSNSNFDIIGVCETKLKKNYRKIIQIKWVSNVNW